jgi:hypothetical protein
MGRDENSAGKVGDCARDMVRGCRRSSCGKVICRVSLFSKSPSQYLHHQNCTIKPPAPAVVDHRHRRLCKACQEAPLSSLITLASNQASKSSPDSPPFLTSDTLKQACCTCPSEGVWLCQPCGRNVRRADADYQAIWKWRTRYLSSLGGLGVGIGEGVRGVACGLGGKCLAAREIEQEIDCDAEDARELELNSRAATPSSSHGSTTGSISSGQMGPGYERHEIEGIGGVVKKKLVKMVKIGACVPEHTEEKNKGTYMVRESERKVRSWCGWCWRVVPGATDIIE